MVDLDLPKLRVRNSVELAPGVGRSIRDLTHDYLKRRSGNVKNTLDTHKSKEGGLTLKTQMFNGATCHAERKRLVINRAAGGTSYAINCCKAKCARLFTTAGLCWEALSIRLLGSSLHGDKVGEWRQRFHFFGRLGRA